jgi:uncharacterized protein
MATMIDRELIRAILAQYTLDPSGIHGVSHWARVLATGRRLARRTGASMAVVELFAVFHDACRVNDEEDLGHGTRGAELAESLHGIAFNLGDNEFKLLHTACAQHTAGRTDGEITVQTCWDADRLDLGRIGKTPDPSRLCTEEARKPELVSWCTRRAARMLVPSWVRSEWGVHRV